MPPLGSTTPDAPLEIEVALPAEIEPALAMVLCDFPEPTQGSYLDSFASSIRSGALPADGLLVARWEGILIGAVLVQVQPGRTALLWPPRTAQSAPAFAAAALLGTACSRLVSAGVRVVHALLATASRRDDRLLRACDFAPLATLLYLQCDDLPCIKPSGEIDFEPYDPADPTRLKNVLLSTYEGSLDCPQLDQLRDLSDILAGYRATGVFAAERWVYVRHGESDVGCLLMTDHPDQAQWELMYMGLARWARGKKWGAHIVRFAQWQTRQAGRDRMVVAVDVANRPAVAVYLTCGFQHWQRRVVYYRNLIAADTPASGDRPTGDLADPPEPDDDTACDHSA